MKNSASLVLLLLTGCSARLSFGQAAQSPIPPYPKWQVTLQVLGEDSRPLMDASAYVSYYVPRAPDAPTKGARQSGLTDNFGYFTASESSQGLIGYGSEKEGYYATRGLEYEFKQKSGEQWIPWNQTFQLVLKKVVQPIPMYAKSVNLRVPINDKPVGYDLTLGDWVAPHGKGVLSDLVFTRQFSLKSANDYDENITVTFSNQGDGIQEFPFVDEGSLLKSPHEAAESGYQSSVTKANNAKPGQSTKFDYDSKRIYFFRVRSELDIHGNVKSALYGKIYGDFLQFRYYLNPSPNDRNIEFDPKQNLLHGLKPSEQVSEP